jgi:nicotinamidase-related amidase
LLRRSAAELYAFDRTHTSGEQHVTIRSISFRSRSAAGAPTTVVRHDWDVAKIAVIICDMWNTTQCVSAAARVTAMAPRMNEVVSQLRRDAALIVHAPASCMEYYAGTPARERAQRAVRVPSPVPIDWNEWDANIEGPLPPALADDTPCSCEPGEPCTIGGPPYPFTRQIETISVAPTDAVTDSGEELLALLEERRINDVVVMGVHTNRCVLGRPYGVRQLVYWGKRPVLCRDLTDAYHRDPRGHAHGNEQMVAHVEQYWCPSVTSDQLAGGTRFELQETVWR